MIELLPTFQLLPYLIQQEKDCKLVEQFEKYERLHPPHPPHRHSDQVVLALDGQLPITAE